MRTRKLVEIGGSIDGGAGDHGNFTISRRMGFESDDDETDAEIVNHEAGKDSRAWRKGGLG